MPRHLGRLVARPDCRRASHRNEPRASPGDSRLALKKYWDTPGQKRKVSILKYLKAKKLTCEPEALEKHMADIHVWTPLLRQVPRKITSVSIATQFKNASENAFWCQAWVIVQAAMVRHDLADPASKRETLRPRWCCCSHCGIVLLRFLARA